MAKGDDTRALGRAAVIRRAALRAMLGGVMAMTIANWTILKTSPDRR
jgi:hypothetical protein